MNLEDTTNESNQTPPRGWDCKCVCVCELLTWLQPAKTH